MEEKGEDKYGDKVGDKVEDKDGDKDGDRDGDKGHSKKEKCLGIIAINERGEAYVQAYKEGDDIKALEFRESKFLDKNKKKKVKKLVEDINEKKLFVEVNELVLSTTEDYQDQLHQLSTLEVSLTNPTRLINLPKQSSDPIRETLRLNDIPLPVEMSVVMKNKAMFEENTDSSMSHKKLNVQENQDLLGAEAQKGTALKSLVPNFLKKKNDYISQPQEILTGHSDPNTDSNDADTKKDRDIHIAINSLREDLMLKLDESSNKIDGLVSVVNGLVTTIETIEANLLKLEGQKLHSTLNYSQSQKKVAPPIPSKPTITGLPCYFHPAPSRVKHIQIQFSSQLNQKLNQEKLQILDDSSGPTVVFSVNASRVISDIQRDLKADTSNGPIFLLVIKATMKPETETERLEPGSLGFDRVEEAAFLLVDTNNKHLYDCTTNEESLNSVIQFLKKCKQGSRM